MLLEIAIVGGISYKFVKFLCSPSKPIKRRRKVKSKSRRPSPNIKTRLLEPFIGHSRHVHQQALVDQKVEISGRERQAQKDLIIGSIGMVFAVFGAIGLPFFYILGTILVGSQWIGFSKKAYRALVKEHRISFDVLNLIMISLAAFGRFFFELIFGNWFYVLMSYLVVKTEDHSQRSLVNLFREQPRFVWVLVDGVELQIPFEQMQAGDIIVINAGEHIPADGVIHHGFASIDQHMLTGEAQPVEKSTGDTVFMATVVLTGKIQIRVKKTGEGTVAAQVGRVLNDTTDFRESLQMRAVTFVEKITLPMLIFSGITWSLLGLSQALGVLITFPGLRMYLLDPLSMLSFLHTASKNGILIKDGRSLELLNKVDTVVFDKTGTLTLEQPHVFRIHCCNGFSEDDVLYHAATAEVKQTHPIARAILSESRKRRLDLPPIEDADYQIGYGITVTVGKHTIRVGSDRFMNQQAISILPDIQTRQKHCHHAGHSLVLVALDDSLIGAIELASTISPEAEAIVRNLKARSLKIIIISGDHEAPTRHLAETLGIRRYCAQVLPEDKAAIVEKLEQEGRSVCFVGDGINDAIALKKATTSVSLRGATTIATDTAQIVLMDGHLDQLEDVFRLAESYNDDIKVNFIFSVAPSLFYTAGAYLFHWTFLTAVIIQQASTVLGLYNVIRPLLNEESSTESLN